MTHLEEDSANSGVRQVERAVAAHYGRLSNGQRRVIDHLLADSTYAAVVSGAELARATGTSESTITRTAQALGFGGYPDLQRHLRARFIQPVQERIAVGNPELQPVSARGIMLEDAEHIRRMADQISDAEIGSVVGALIAARRVLVIGVRGSHGLAEMLSIGLRLMLPDVRLLNATAGDLPEQLIGLGATDVVVAVSFRRVDQDTVNVLKWATDVGATTIGIADHRSSQVARLSRHSLMAMVGTLRLMPSFAPGASLVNAILAGVAAHASGAASDRLENAEALWERFESYTSD